MNFDLPTILMLIGVIQVIVLEIPANFRLIDSKSTPSRLIFAQLERNGEVKTGT